jgi:hypothetical protein
MLISIQHNLPSLKVGAHGLSSLNFTRNHEARLLPLARGLLYSSFSAPADLMAYASQIGEMPVYSIVYNTLKGLATNEELCMPLTQINGVSFNSTMSRTTLDNESIE